MLNNLQLPLDWLRDVILAPASTTTRKFMEVNFMPVLIFLNFVGDVS